MIIDEVEAGETLKLGLQRGRGVWEWGIGEEVVHVRVDDCACGLGVEYVIAKGGAKEEGEGGELKRREVSDGPLREKTDQGGGDLRKGVSSGEFESSEDA